MGGKQRIEHGLAQAAARWPDRPALELNGDATTYGQLWPKAVAWACTLRQRGVQPGDRVALCGRKSPEYVATLYGIWRAGAVAVPMSPDLRPRQLSHILRKSGARLLVHDRHCKLDSAEGETMDLGPAPGEPAMIGLDLGAIELTAVDFEAPVDEQESNPAFIENSLAILLFTSGSTGLPKGIMVSHDNLVVGAHIVTNYLGITAEDRLLSVLPFHFDYGLNQLLSSVHVGATLVLQRSTHPGHVLGVLAEREITVVAGVPPLWAQLFADASPIRRRALPKLRCLTNSGGAFPLELLSATRSILADTEIYLMYGLSEAFRSTYLPPQELDRRPGSMGRAIPQTDVLVVDDDGQICGPNQVGELVHRGPTVALGYWDEPQATARVFREDPFDASSAAKVVYSGDQVYRDEEGFLFFVGRRDQQLKSFGHRVNPEEVEGVLHNSAIVHMVVVGATPHRAAGHGVVAHVVPRAVGADHDSGACEAGLRAYCRANMPSYMVPREIFFHDKFPLTASGKVDRRAVLA